MLTCQLLIKKPIVSTKEVKVVLERNHRVKLDTEDYDGRVVTLSIPIEDYRYVRENIGRGNVEEIFYNALSKAGIPDGYKILAVFKDSFSSEVES